MRQKLVGVVPDEDVDAARLGSHQHDRYGCAVVHLSDEKNDVLVSNIFTGTNVKTQLGYCRMQYISYESIRQESLSFYCFTVNDLFLKLTQTSIFFIYT